MFYVVVFACLGVLSQCSGCLLADLKHFINNVGLDWIMQQYVTTAPLLISKQSLLPRYSLPVFKGFMYTPHIMATHDTHGCFSFFGGVGFHKKQDLIAHIPTQLFFNLNRTGLQAPKFQSSCAQV